MPNCATRRPRVPERGQTRPTGGASQLAPTVDVSAGQRGGGCEIRTPEGLPPTRFPSVRPRPLGESSAGQLTGAADARERPQLRTRPARLTSRPLARRLSRQIPQGRKAARVRELWWVCGGFLPVLARITSWQATRPVPPPRTRPAPAARQPRLRWRFTAGTARRRSLRSAARITSQNH